MASVNIEVLDEDVPRVLEAFCERFGWVDEATSGNQADFAKGQVAKWIRQVTLDHERRKAEEAALAAVTDPVVVDVT